MCCDICAINIRVSIRVRGLHLVSLQESCQVANHHESCNSGTEFVVADSVSFWLHQCSLGRTNLHGEISSTNGTSRSHLHTIVVRGGRVSPMLAPQHGDAILSPEAGSVPKPQTPSDSQRWHRNISYLVSSFLDAVPIKKMMSIAKRDPEGTCSSWHTMAHPHSIGTHLAKLL